MYQGTVRQSVYLGDMIEYAVDVDGVSILGTETDPHVIELFPEGENKTRLVLLQEKIADEKSRDHSLENWKMVLGSLKRVTEDASRLNAF